MNDPDEMNSSEPTDLKVGTRVDRYEILSEIGRGGMGVVFKARDVEIGREVALKVMLGITPDSEQTGRFLQEAQLLGRLNHPGIVPILHFGTQPYPYIAMRLIKGTDLATHLAQRRNKLPIKTVLSHADRILDALTHIHEKGTIHRDIKPSNILLSEDGYPLLSDFGIAKDLHTESMNLTRTGQALGDFRYAAPEQITGNGSIGPWSDLFSFGVVLYEMLTGRSPFSADAGPEAMNRILDGVYAPASSVSPRIDKRFDIIISYLLASSPDQRFQTAHSLRTALLTHELPQDLPPLPKRRMAKRKRRISWMLYVAFLLIPLVYVFKPGDLEKPTDKSHEPLVMIENSGLNPVSPPTPISTEPLAPKRPIPLPDSPKSSTTPPTQSAKDLPKRVDHESPTRSSDPGNSTTPPAEVKKTIVRSLAEKSLLPLPASINKKSGFQNKLLPKSLRSGSLNLSLALCRRLARTSCSWSQWGCDYGSDLGMALFLGQPRSWAAFSLAAGKLDLAALCMRYSGFTYSQRAEVIDRWFKVHPIPPENLRPFLSQYDTLRNLSPSKRTLGMLNRFLLDNEASIYASGMKAEVEDLWIQTRASKISLATLFPHSNRQKRNNDSVLLEYRLGDPDARVFSATDSSKWEKFKKSLVGEGTHHFRGKWSSLHAQISTHFLPQCEEFQLHILDANSLTLTGAGFHIELDRGTCKLFRSSVQFPLTFDNRPLVQKTSGIPQKPKRGRSMRLDLSYLPPRLTGKVQGHRACSTTLPSEYESASLWLQSRGKTALGSLLLNGKLDPKWEQKIRKTVALRFLHREYENIENLREGLRRSIQLDTTHGFQEETPISGPLPFNGMIPLYPQSDTRRLRAIRWSGFILIPDSESYSISIRTELSLKILIGTRWHQNISEDSRLRTITLTRKLNAGVYPFCIELSSPSPESTLRFYLKATHETGYFSESWQFFSIPE
ncbi:MAG: serine/threonine-protein kinase [Planctomycetota bacterium]|jgi:serine/threonine protein kinase|nr:serine/threonine-protein kinase [Planctomycetota bacterium]